MPSGPRRVQRGQSKVIDTLPKGLEIPFNAHARSVAVTQEQKEVLILYTTSINKHSDKPQYSMVPIESYDNYSEYS